MATRIRLRRVGRKKQASFRIVVAGSMHSNSGRVTETIGKYNPRTRPSYIEVDEARALYWLREGAEMSESVRPLFRQLGILRKFAEKAEGEGSAVRGDREGRTVLATRPGAAEATPMEESEKAVEKKKARPEAKGTPESEAKPPEAKPLDVKGPEAKGSEAAAASSESGAEVEEVATEEVAEAEEGGKEE